MNKISFDFNKFVDICFKSTITHFVSLPIALDILMMFMIEGVKIFFRYTYAVMKCNKQLIKSIRDPAVFLELLKAESREKTSPQKIHKKALKYPLKRKNYDFKKANIEALTKDPNSQIGESELSDYMPNCPMNSEILKFDEFVKMWGFLPDYVKIRIPELVFQATSDGFNLQSLYRKMVPYKNEYKFSLLLFQTKKNEVFGAFIDEAFRKYLKGYTGSSDCFVFSLKPTLKVWYDQQVNDRYLLGEQDYFTVGGDGDGPAIWVNETLERGQTNCSATFANQLLNGGEKGKDEQFDIHNIELYIL